MNFLLRNFAMFLQNSHSTDTIRLRANFARQGCRWLSASVDVLCVLALPPLGSFFIKKIRSVASADYTDGISATPGGERPSARQVQHQLVPYNHCLVIPPCDWANTLRQVVILSKQLYKSVRPFFRCSRKVFVDGYYFISSPHASVERCFGRFGR